MNKSIEDAMRYISNEMKSNPNIDKLQLISEASQKFDLNPMQTEFLTNKFIIEK